MGEERDYWLTRALEEDEAARKAGCPQARKCHEQLAVAYRRRTLGVAPDGEREDNASKPLKPSALTTSRPRRRFPSGSSAP